MLRNSLDVHGPKFGCGLGQCGACTVLIDGASARSCVTPVSKAVGHAVTTIESLGTPERPDRVQAAFIAEQAAQCGYCTSGMVMAATALLKANPNPTVEQVKNGLARNSAVPPQRHGRRFSTSVQRHSAVLHPSSPLRTAWLVRWVRRRAGV